MFALLAQAATNPAVSPAVDVMVEVYKKAQFPLFTVMFAVALAGWAALNYIWKLKEALYDREGYHRLVSELQDIDPGLPTMAGFNELRTLNFGVIFGAMFVGVLQVSLGFVYERWSSVFCLVAAASVIAAVGYELYLIRQTSNRASEIAETEAQAKVADLRKARLAGSPTTAK